MPKCPDLGTDPRKNLALAPPFPCTAHRSSPRLSCRHSPASRRTLGSSCSHTRCCGTCRCTHCRRQPWLLKGKSRGFSPILHPVEEPLRRMLGGRCCLRSHFGLSLGRTAKSHGWKGVSAPWQCLACHTDETWIPQESYSWHCDPPPSTGSYLCPQLS